MVERATHASADALERDIKVKIRDSWDAQRERAIGDVGERCLGYEWMHSQCARHYRRWSSISSAAQLLASSLSTLLVAATSQSPNPESMTACTILGSLSTVVTAAAKYADMDTTASMHENIARAFSRLKSEIQVQTKTPREDRMHAVDFYEKIHAQYNQTADDGPSLPDWVIAGFKAKVEREQLNIALPDIANGYWTSFR